MTSPSNTLHTDVIIIGGGAAGVFLAANLAEWRPDLNIIILEQSKQLLQKVRISGGGRCNVTNVCSDPRELILNYPRGSKELLGPFFTFGPNDTVSWFEERGVPLKSEDDGRIFPVSDDSNSIVQCLMKEINKDNVTIAYSSKVGKITYDTDHIKWHITTQVQTYSCRYIAIAAGASNPIWAILSNLGHSIVTPVPSLFTFNLLSHPITSLMGVRIPQALVSIDESPYIIQGDILVTHWGLSGPGIIKCSAWAARHLFDLQYNANFYINFEPHLTFEQFKSNKTSYSKKKITFKGILTIPHRLWIYIIEQCRISHEKTWSDINQQEWQQLYNLLTHHTFMMQGKTTFKEEFVTAGGVALSEMHFKTFESKILPTLYLCGEILDIDGITGGFNFQAAWTGGYLAAQAIADTA